MSDCRRAAARRTVACFLLAFIAVADPIRAYAIDAPEGTIRWTIWREGLKVGRQTMIVHHAGAKLLIDNEIDITVRRINVYVTHRYVLRAKETWTDGKLVELAAIVNNDDESAGVDATRTPSGFIVDGDGGHFEAPSNLVPSTLWHIDMTKSDAVLDVETGKLLSVKSSVGAEVPLPVNGRDVPARHVSISGDTTRELWYGPDGVLVRAQFDGLDGVPLDFRVDPR
ncbi:MAG TPA: DUF6134 family protein [Alphaproteobacteria bacterium]|nr:DUF6134 family protein [Alphaproteobacteria bacterium]